MQIGNISSSAKLRRLVDWSKPLLLELTKASLWRGLSLALTVLGGAWVARQMGPAKMALGAIAIAAASQIIAVSGACLDPLFVRDYLSHEEEAGRSEVLFLAFAVRLTFLLPASLIFTTYAAIWQKELLGWWPVLAAGGFVVGQAVSVTWYFQARGNFASAQKLAWTQATLSSAADVGFVRKNSSAGFDAALSSIILLITNLGMLRVVIKEHAGKLRIPRLAQCGRFFWRAKYLSLTALAIQCYIGTDLILVSRFATVREAGIYRGATVLVAGAQALFAIPVALIYPSLVRWQKDSHHAQFAKQSAVFGLFVGASIPVVVAGYFLAPFLLEALYGPAFRSGAVFVTGLICAKLLAMCHSTYSASLWASGRDFTLLVIVCIAAGFSIAANCLLIPRFGATAACFVAVGSEIIVLGGSLIAILYLRTLKRSRVIQSRF
jgi:O-antigen/teichoic acid export membrane protein